MTKQLASLKPPAHEQIQTAREKTIWNGQQKKKKKKKKKKMIKIKKIKKKKKK